MKQNEIKPDVKEKAILKVKKLIVAAFFEDLARSLKHYKHELRSHLWKVEPDLMLRWNRHFWMTFRRSCRKETPEKRSKHILKTRLNFDQTSFPQILEAKIEDQGKAKSIHALQFLAPGFPLWKWQHFEGAETLIFACFRRQAEVGIGQPSVGDWGGQRRRRGENEIEKNF